MAALAAATAGAQPTPACASSDSAVYAAVLDSLYPSVVEKLGGIIRREPIDLSRRGSAAWVALALAQRLPDFDTALVTRLHAPRAHACGPAQALSTRPELFWRAPAAPHSSGIAPIVLPWQGGPELRFSAIEYSADGLTALLYRSFWCGVLCAHADYLVLRRDADQRWRIVATLFVSAS